MMITLQQARQKFILSVSKQTATEQVALHLALGRVAAADQHSAIAVPPSDNSAMDGFAVNSKDLDDGASELTISQRIPAGAWPDPLQTGTAARIFTGGVMPSGADAVVIQENCNYRDGSDQVTILKSVSAAENVRPKGQDIAVGAKIIAAGSKMNAVHLGLLASIGCSTVSVYRTITVAVFSTGNELIEPGQALEPGQIYNSNRTMLLALCHQMGYQTIDCGIVEDTLEATKAALKHAAQQADIIISSGGVSVGEEDHIKPAIEALGSLQHWKVQMKPGKPVVLGSVIDTPILGLPGNPVSSYVVFQLLGIPLLKALQGEVVVAPIAFKVVAGFDKRLTSREEYIRVRISSKHESDSAQENLDSDQPVAQLFNNQSSGVLSSLAWADGLVRQSIDQIISKGDTVDFLPLREGLL
ncbi:MAG: molybdopterin molybdotransferase [Polaribacter sp.]|jgi:molybdopterin molybdotransferase